MVFLRSYLLAALALLVLSSTCQAEESGKTPLEHLAVDLRIIAYGKIQTPSSSTQNPSNDFLQVPRYVGVLEARPDIRLDMGRLDVSARPRARLEYAASTEGRRKGASEWDHDFFMNEWLARWMIVEALSLSYGRENLQWGPSLLFSPSNPFFKDNDRRNPYIELPGMDFGRVVWIPSRSWTVSFIANTGKGRAVFKEPLSFEKTYALKADYTGSGKYGSLILCHKKGHQSTLGGFGGWTVSDSLLLYGEVAVSRDVDALYPVKDRSPFGASMQVGRGERTLNPDVLIGISYTLERGGNFTFEYAYYGAGYDNEEADLYYTLRARGEEAVVSGKFLSGLGLQVLADTVYTGLRLERRNYALLQYTHQGFLNLSDLVLRWTKNLDDGSGQFTMNFSYPFGSHFELFSVGTVMTGGREKEFRKILDYQWMIGLTFTL